MSQKRSAGVFATPMFETLEGRRLLSASVTASVVNGRLVVVGTPGADEIAIAQLIDDPTSVPPTGVPVSLGVQINGEPLQKFTLPWAATVVIRTGRGDDNVYLGGLLHSPVGEEGRSYRPMPLAARVDAGAGDDTVGCGSRGGSVVLGGAGNDYLTAGVAGDVMRGGAGDDFMLGANGRDRLFGGPGADVFRTGDADDERPDFGRRDEVRTFPTLTP